MNMLHLQRNDLCALLYCWFCSQFNETCCGTWPGWTLSGAISWLSLAIFCGWTTLSASLVCTPVGRHSADILLDVFDAATRLSKLHSVGFYISFPYNMRAQPLKTTPPFKYSACCTSTTAHQPTPAICSCIQTSHLQVWGAHLQPHQISHVYHLASSA